MSLLLARLKPTWVKEDHEADLKLLLSLWNPVLHLPARRGADAPLRHLLESLKTPHWILTGAWMITGPGHQSHTEPSTERRLLDIIQ